MQSRQAPSSLVRLRRVLGRRTERGRPDIATSLRTWVDLIGAAGVLVGLIFVGLELRGNTQAIRAQTFQNLTDISNDYIMQIAGDPELARIFHTAKTGGVAALSDEEKGRYWSIQRAFWVRMQNVHSQYERGTLEDEDFALYRAVICGGGQGERDMWPEHRMILTRKFVAFVEACWAQ